MLSLNKNNMRANESNEHANLDTAFYKILQEIEKAYLVLPKNMRIRVEKWVEKLVAASSSNISWKKSRNGYIKALLKMILSRNLTEPFNSLPPDGPLPAFPFHLKVANKDLHGLHESNFWRSTFQRVQEAPPENIFIDKSRIPENNIGLNQIKRAHPEFSREIDNLNFLIKEQQQRIILLEEQLQHERVQHELQIQRLEYQHKLELNKYLSERVENLRSSSNIPQLSDSNSFFLPNPSLDIKNSFTNKTINPSFFHNEKLDPERNSLLFPNKEIFDSNIYFDKCNSKYNTNNKNNITKDLFPNKIKTSESNMLSNDNTILLSKTDDIEFSNIDILPFQKFTKEQNTNKTFAEQPEKPVLLSQESSIHKESSDEEFLEYLTKFKDDLHKINSMDGKNIIP